jgi:hypothetical protein
VVCVWWCNSTCMPYATHTKNRRSHFGTQFQGTAFISCCRLFCLYCAHHAVFKLYYLWFKIHQFLETVLSSLFSLTTGTKLTYSYEQALQKLHVSDLVYSLTEVHINPHSVLSIKKSNPFDALRPVIYTWWPHAIHAWGGFSILRVHVKC